MLSFVCELHVTYMYKCDDFYMWDQEITHAKCFYLCASCMRLTHMNRMIFTCDIVEFHTYFACKIHVNHMWIFMIFTCETWFSTLFPYFAYFHMWKHIFFTCMSHVNCMQVTCEISHPFTCEKWCLHVMGHISHENVHCSHVNHMRKTVVHMRKVRMRTACEILTRTDEFKFFNLNMFKM